MSQNEIATVRKPIPYPELEVSRQPKFLVAIGDRRTVFFDPCNPMGKWLAVVNRGIDRGLLKDEGRGGGGGRGRTS